MTYEKAIELIKKFEGCSLKAYKCPAGVWTIGYGHTKGVKIGQVITQLQAEVLLLDDIEVVVSSIKRLLKVNLGINQLCALISFTFNVGVGNLQKSTLLKLINEKKLGLAANEFNKWVYANKKKLNGLVKRRQAEKDLFLTD